MTVTDTGCLDVVLYSVQIEMCPQTTDWNTTVFVTLRGVYTNTTQLNSTSSCRHVHSVNNCHPSMNVVTQFTQFVGRDVMNKNTTDLLRADWLYAVQLGQLS